MARTKESKLIIQTKPILWGGRTMKVGGRKLYYKCRGMSYNDAVEIVKKAVLPKKLKKDYQIVITSR